MPRALLIALAAAVVLYALQAAYSSDIAFATRNVGFFLVPFAVMFALLAEVGGRRACSAWRWRCCSARRVLFALVGVGQHVAGEIFWNAALERSNDFHFYFRVNSLFWDPNIYGRYLALAAVLAVAVIAVDAGRPRLAALAAALAVILLSGCCLGFSQTSFLALLPGPRSSARCAGAGVDRR